MKFTFLPFAFLFALAVPLFGDSPLRPGDVIEVRLSGVNPEFSPEFSQAYTLDEQGNVNLTYLGQIKASGMQVTQLQTLIEQKLKDRKIYSHPTITINIPQGNRFVNVSGAVRAPGRVPFSNDLTITTAIGAVGGPNEFAGDKIFLTHDGKKTVHSRKAIKKDPLKDVKVQPGDVIDLTTGWY